MVTKFNEQIIETSNIEVMKDKFLAERLLRSWKEKFVDEDTGETVEIERNEIIFEKGTLLTPHEISEINFLLQSEDVKKVSVSTQQRSAHHVRGVVKVWVATIDLHRKKKAIYLYANSIDQAFKIAVDYIEQRYEGFFRVLSLKELDYTTLISKEMVEHENDEDDFYNMLVGVTYTNEEMREQNYIIRASDAENAKESIIKYIALNAPDNIHDDNFEVTIISAKTIKCNDVVDYRFSTDYFENEDA